MNKLLVAILLSMAIFSTAADAAQLTVNVQNIDQDKGEIRVLLYDQRTYLTTNPVDTKTKPATPGTLAFTFETVPPGNWAVLAYHDANSNHDLDRNFLGIPEEQFGFSNNPGYNHQPDFAETRLVIDGQDVAIDVKLSDK